MSGSLTRPDYGSNIASLARRLDNLERRTTPKPPGAPDDGAFTLTLWATDDSTLGTMPFAQGTPVYEIRGGGAEPGAAASPVVTVFTGPLFVPAGVVFVPQVDAVGPAASGWLCYLNWFVASTEGQRLKAQSNEFVVADDIPVTADWDVDAPGGDLSLADGSIVSDVGSGGAGPYWATLTANFTPPA